MHGHEAINRLLRFIYADEKILTHELESLEILTFKQMGSKESNSDPNILATPETTSVNISFISNCSMTPLPLESKIRKKGTTKSLRRSLIGMLWFERSISLTEMRRIATTSSLVMNPFPSASAHSSINLQEPCFGVKFVKESPLSNLHYILQKTTHSTEDSPKKRNRPLATYNTNSKQWVYGFFG